MSHIHRQRPNWIEIDLDALLANLRQIKSMHPGAKMLLPVKADAYGHGILACSFAAIEAGVDYLGVAHLFEAIPLRQYGCKAPILILGPLLEEDFEQVIAHRLIPTLVDLATAQAFDSWLGSQGMRSKVHVKIDTGMSRYGFAWNDLELRKLGALQNLQFEGVFTHMACAEDACAVSNELQIKRFKEVLELLPFKPQIVHFSNSAAVMNAEQFESPMIRPGLASYGYNPLYPAPSKLPLKPVLSLYSTIRQVRTVPAGEGVSYGHRYITKSPTKVVAVAIGYGDGIFRTQGEGLFVQIREKLCPVIGTVCMDTCLVDASSIEDDLQVGEMVRIIDGAHCDAISMEAVAGRAGTIPYELTCRMARRLYRLYRYQGELLRWDELRLKLGIVDPLFALGF